MPKSKLLTNLEYAATRVVLTAFQILPLRASLVVGPIFGRVGYYFSKRLRRTGDRNLALAFPELDGRARRRLLQSFFANLGRLLAVFSKFESDDPNTLKQVIECEGLEHLEAAENSHQGVILFTGHLGAWELSSFALSLLGHPLSFLVRRIENSRVEQLIERRRTFRGNRTIDKRLAAREMVQVLREGGTLGILVDLNTLDREAIFVKFFGVDAATSFTAAKLALRTGAQVLPVFAPWDKARRKFILKIDRPVTIEASQNEAQNTINLTQAMTKVVEDYVRRYPDQWLWIHRRWKTRPAGEAKIY